MRVYPIYTWYRHLAFPNKIPRYVSHSTHLFRPVPTKTKDFFRLYGEPNPDATTKVRRPKMPATVSGRLQGDFDGKRKNRRSGSGSGWGRVGRVLWGGCVFFSGWMDFWSGGGMYSRWFSLGWFICATLIFCGKDKRLQSLGKGQLKG